MRNTNSAARLALDRFLLITLVSEISSARSINRVNNLGTWCKYKIYNIILAQFTDESNSIVAQANSNRDLDQQRSRTRQKL